MVEADESPERCRGRFGAGREVRDSVPTLGWPLITVCPGSLCPFPDGNLGFLKAKLRWGVDWGMGVPCSRAMLPRMDSGIRTWETSNPRPEST